MRYGTRSSIPAVSEPGPRSAKLLGTAAHLLITATNARTAVFRRRMIAGGATHTLGTGNHLRTFARRILIGVVNLRQTKADDLMLINAMLTTRFSAHARNRRDARRSMQARPAYRNHPIPHGDRSIVGAMLSLHRDRRRPEVADSSCFLLHPPISALPPGEQYLVPQRKLGGFT